jgi:SAM-dependent methyltransferase
VGVRRTETSLIVWSQSAPNSANALNQDQKKNTEKAEQLREGVRLAYSAVAEDPQMKHPFPVGREFAKSLGYPPELIASLPAAAVDAFAGVSNVSIFADIPKAATVLDLGCGTGLDSLIAARKVGPEGHVIGVDFSQTMLARARQAAAEAGIGNVEFCRADAETLRLEDASIDVALVNGIFNLNPARASIFSELARVVRPGGAVYAAEIILCEPLPPEVQESEANWFA